MTVLHLPVDPSVEPEHDKPAADKVISGDPSFTTWNLEEHDGLFCGIWQATPGKWRVSYDEWEYFSVLEGHSVLTPEDGAPVTLKAGARMILRPGFKGTWEVVETTTKDYVIRI
ncbi:cupin domain-containing protein [Sulfitobacter sp. D35]|uniref:cupin domain-containing protein n=1 Tax=Sulfitobacter sp. D35 TaxID=3083252 RepID=UPI00296EB607|nr:cupin domain-containing protein [Sulfitobacter sp. D35]MDW4498985.1 cupin domain-containing protein [Sulfitobacter sp. D35]